MLILQISSFFTFDRTEIHYLKNENQYHECL